MDKDSEKNQRAVQKKRKKRRRQGFFLDVEIVAEKREEGMKGCMQLISETNKKEIGCINTFNTDQLNLVLCYYDDDAIYVKKGTKKVHWVEAVMKHYKQQRMVKAATKYYKQQRMNGQTEIK
eukprot:3644165-Ditylum_brightwellii.AAC.1